MTKSNAEENYKKCVPMSNHFASALNMFLIRYIRTLVQSSCELIGASLEPICEQREYEGYRCERKEVPVGGGGER